MNHPTNALTVLGIEQGLRAAVPEAVFASPRVVRRIIRADLDLPLLLARVPHRESIAISPARLLELADDVWALPERCPDTILLVARPDPSPLTAGDSDGLLREYWRRLYHGCLDIAARHCLATHAADGEDFARLVHDVGETAFDEARSVLVQEGRVREGDGTRTVLAEFIAVFLEFVAFAPDLLPVWFPALADGQGLRDRLASRVDVAEAAKEDDFVAGQDRLADRQVGEEGRAVLASCFDFTSDADDMRDAATHVPLHVTVVGVAIDFGHQYADVTADHLALRVPEEPLTGAIKAFDVSLGVDDHDGIDRRIEQRLKIALNRTVFGVERHG